MLKLHTLQNGLRVMLVPLKESNSVTILKGYAVGSRNETPANAGASHFIEHMMFKGAKKYKTAKEISKALDALGAGYNAYTAKDHTAFYVKVASVHFKKAADIFFDMLYHAHFNQEDFERERGVILQEIKMYEDNPSSYVDTVFEEACFANTSLAKDIIGTTESIKKMTQQDLVSHMERHYNDKHSVLVIAGKYPSNILTLLKKWVPKSQTWKSHEPYQVELQDIKGPRVAHFKKKVEQVPLGLGFRGVGYNHKDSHIYNLICTYLGGGMSSELFHELREKKGLCYYVSMHPSLYKDTGSVLITAGVNKTQVQDSVRVIVDVIRTFVKNGITKQALEETKSQMIGRYLLALENNEVHAESYMKRILVGGEILTPQQRIKRITKITRGDILRVSRQLFKKSNAILALVDEKINESQLLKELQRLP